ncbi:ATP-binding domain-containing protein [Paenibacillus dokdonensis]|uniref:ATP-binding domain-containing protein n=1 Tax=Paenibacillus dokdonensis TaxID=2567944 RepID=UPI00319DE3EF
MDELNGIRKLSREFLESKHYTLGIVCKTGIQANQVYEAIRELHPDVHLLDFRSESFHEGITVTFSHMAKGLEFDQVIVPFVDGLTYQTELDRSLLYVACTRAMHILHLTCSGKITAFLQSLD